MAEEFLNGPDVVAGFEQVGGEAVAEGVAARVLEEAGGGDGPLDGFLERGLGEVVAADDARAGVGAAPGGGDEVLPAEVTVGVGVFLGRGVGEVNAA